MTSERRRRLGWIGVVAGAILLIAGVLIAHFTNLPVSDSVGRDIYSWIPRCAPFESDPNSCWILPTVGQATAVLGSQLIVVGIVLGWLFDRPLTWARATVGAFLFTLEILVVLAIVPNQMVALMQGTFEWTSQKEFVKVPPWLVLNNNVSISYGTLKDLLVAGYTTTMLVAALVIAYQYQERMQRRGQPKPPTTSVYGRPVVKGGGR
ncbi:MAG TPA: hypothetical protein VK960_07320 [Acidimicrobiia bacterium]|nr:hypothetical protein [Acidimicrobiia bacterium]